MQDTTGVCYAYSYDHNDDFKRLEIQIPDEVSAPDWSRVWASFSGMNEEEATGLADVKCEKNGREVKAVYENRNGTVYIRYKSEDGIVYQQTTTLENPEKVNHPSHYNSGKIEVIDFIEDQELGFNLGNVIKYVCRAGKKKDFESDLKKALWYLKREYDRRMGKLETTTKKNFKGERE